MKTDKTQERIKNEIDRIDKELAELQVKRSVLQGILDEAGDDKPDGFKITKAAMAVLEANPNVGMSVNVILKKISTDWRGYKPPRRSLQITLNTWDRQGKVKKDEQKGTYMLEKPV